MRRLVSALMALLIAVGIGTTQHPASSVHANAPSSSGGAVLDAFGGIHVFGNASLNTSGAPYWPNWSIASSLSVLPDGSGGWVLDAWGGVHAFGAAPQVFSNPYWRGWYIARALVMLPNGSPNGWWGYELDGFGGVHPVNGAPLLSGYAYWPNWYIATGLDIHTNTAGVPDGGWTLDRWGGIHAFGNAPTLDNPHYTGTYDLWKTLHVVAGGAYLLAQNGIIQAIGTPAGVNWAGFPSWGAWDVVTDVALINASWPSGTPTPAPDRAQLGAAMDYLHNEDRLLHGLWALQYNDGLAAIAGNGASYNTANCGGNSGVIADRSQDMVARNYFAHPIEGCPGTQYVFSTYERGMPYHTVGENIAWTGGSSDPIDVLTTINSMWLNSPPHFANMMSHSYSQIGCGMAATNGPYQGFVGATSVWTCEFLG
ncbi:MAG TPA: CAP domain-containing protein [Candidatus Dormibacteraeota bacterium]|nr:CAP domain-containing protein [Candidatus Dormibacteraeota bacterium]